MNYNRLYELQKICANQLKPSDCYFYDIDDLLKEDEAYYSGLAQEINRLDEDAWYFIKKELACDMNQHSNHRGWTQLFNKLNEVKGYIYLTDLGCFNVSFIPTSQKQGVETPDLQGEKDNKKYLCEVKTINKSDYEINRVKNGLAKSVSYELNDGLKSQIKTVISKAKSQLVSYDIENNTEKIAYIIIENDDKKPEPINVIYPQILLYVTSFMAEGFKVEIRLT